MMKAGITVFCVLLSLTAGAAFAQLDPGPDGIGIYADMDAAINRLEAAEGESFELHVLVTGLDAIGIGAWEMSLYYEGPVMNIGHLIPYQHISVGIWPSFTIGVMDYLPAAPVIHLMTLTFMITGEGPADLYIQAAHVPEGGSMGNDLPVFVNGMIHEDLRPMYPSSGSVDLPVFRFNGEAPVATSPASWSSVKALFR
jgi:hypothetical protein